MAAKDKDRPIIIIKRKRAAAAGHHGGAWKVAYADFITAMMAFFMVMWLVASVNKEQRAAIFDYFKNPSMEHGESVKAAPGQAGPGGASTSVINMGGAMDAPKTNLEEQQALGQIVQKNPEDETKKLAREIERRRLEALMQELKEAIDKSQALEPFKDQLLLDITPEGLRIQIVDKQNRPMFDLGKSHLKDYTNYILREVAKYLNTVPNRVSLSGHTDDKAYVGARGYTNWELSADRANAARRALLDGGLESHKIARVVGLASSALFDKQNPYNPINRRISIIVMTKSTEAAALATDAPDVEVARQAIESGAAAAVAPVPSKVAPVVSPPSAPVAPAAASATARPTASASGPSVPKPAASTAAPSASKPAGAATSRTPASAQQVRPAVRSATSAAAAAEAALSAAAKEGAR